ncbi:T9SS type A sorting domain-containing protein [Flammeovirgaceae bacterium SG7u.111]|nr:T9SS type A sorting domain-containing protein [Flammeovirgaceae bacterium SG7u.132]WPO37737.1 T9SS type A sorting domain-containing protein [Flammeovirgaceae bacterium SG7u.111]
MKKIYFYFQIALLFCVLSLFTGEVRGQRVLESNGVGGGVWDLASTWTCTANCNANPTIPTFGDFITIKTGDVIVIDGYYNYHLTDPTNIGSASLPLPLDGLNINIFGSLEFQGAQAQLILPFSSIFTIQTGGIIDFESNQNINESQGIRIGEFSDIAYFSNLGSPPKADIPGPRKITALGGIGPLPVTLTSFTASANNSFTNIRWSTASEWDFSHYEIEKSFDGINFDFVAEVDPKGGEGLLADYTYTDLFPGRDLIYYRLKMVDLDGSFEYSKVVAVSTKASLEALSVFPNPAPNGHFSLYYPNAFGKEVQVSVMNTLGMEVFTRTLVLDKDVLDIAPERELQSGHYMLNVQIDGQVFRKHLVFE